MTAGEIRRSQFGSINQSTKISIHRAWSVVGETSQAAPATVKRIDARVEALGAFLASTESLPDDARAAIESLLRDQRALEGELHRQRSLLQEWILSQQTYKALYYQYSGQSADSPRPELMHEMEQMRRSIRKQLHGDGETHAVLEQQPCSVSAL
jgi:hypothetical protein